MDEKRNEFGDAVGGNIPPQEAVQKAQTQNGANAPESVEAEIPETTVTCNVSTDNDINDKEDPICGESIAMSVAAVSDDAGDVGNTADISDNSIDKYSDNDDDDDPELLARELEAYLREQDDPDDGKGIFGGYIRLPAFIVLCIGVLAGAVHLVLALSTRFSDFMSVTVSAALRFCLAKLTGVLPFSLAETLIFMLPAVIILLFVISNAYAASKRKWWRFFFSLLAVISYMYSLFVFSFVPSYNCTKLEDRLGLDRHDVSAQQLYDTALVLTDEINSLTADITFLYKDASIMPYDIGELSDRICEAYDRFTPTHSFIQSMHTRIKPLAISPLMTYTHIAGVYAFYTGESNLNTNFPDYTIPYTVAHELAHQRGIAREDEANFIAYLVCMESDDVYIRYSASMSVLEYVYSALSQADTDLYNRAVGQLDLHAIYEMQSYSRFFAKYARNTAATVSGAVNDTFLKLSGQSAGSKSYGLVVDLAVAYICPDSK